MVENNGLIPNHQFSFRQRHSTIEQSHQIVRINEALENKQYGFAAFLVPNQCWHTPKKWPRAIIIPTIH
jgi:hypothetical protein